MIQHPLICWKLYYLFESLLTSLASPFSDWPTMALVYWALPGFHWYLWPSPFLPAPSTNWLLLQATLNMFIVLPICPHAPLFFCCAMWAFGILVPQPGMEPVPPGLEAQSLKLSSCGRGLSCFASYGILVPRPGIEPWPLALGAWLSPGLPGISRSLHF